MGRQLSVGLVVFASWLLVGCGESAEKKDFIDAPTVSTDQKASMKARGLTDEQMAAADKKGAPDAPR